MSKKQLPTPELLRKLLRYESYSGKLFWLERTIDMFGAGGNGGALGNMRRWNARFANKEALTARNADGYCNGRIFGETYLAHRVIWAMYYDEWPDDQIDHENHVRNDNRIKNLLDASYQDNCRNQKMYSNNTSGFTGVSKDKASGKWVSSIKIMGKSIHLGYFDKKTDAISARKQANINHGFHSNHGVKL